MMTKVIEVVSNSYDGLADFHKKEKREGIKKVLNDLIGLSGEIRDCRIIFKGLRNAAKTSYIFYYDIV